MFLKDLNQQTKNQISVFPSLPFPSLWLGFSWFGFSFNDNHFTLVLRLPRNCWVAFIWIHEFKTSSWFLHRPVRLILYTLIFSNISVNTINSEHFNSFIYYLVFSWQLCFTSCFLHTILYSCDALINTRTTCGILFSQNLLL